MADDICDLAEAVLDFLRAMWKLDPSALVIAIAAQSLPGLSRFAILDLASLKSKSAEMAYPGPVLTLPVISDVTVPIFDSPLDSLINKSLFSQANPGVFAANSYDPILCASEYSSSYQSVAIRSNATGVNTGPVTSNLRGTALFFGYEIAGIGLAPINSGYSPIGSVGYAGAFHSLSNIGGQYSNYSTTVYPYPYPYVTSGTNLLSDNIPRTPVTSSLNSFLNARSVGEDNFLCTNGSFVYNGSFYANTSGSAPDYLLYYAGYQISNTNFGFGTPVYVGPVAPDRYNYVASLGYYNDFTYGNNYLFYEYNNGVDSPVLAISENGGTAVYFTFPNGLSTSPSVSLASQGFLIPNSSQNSVLSYTLIKYDGSGIINITLQNYSANLPSNADFYSAKIDASGVFWLWFRNPSTNTFHLVWSADVQFTANPIIINPLQLSALSFPCYDPCNIQNPTMIGQ